MSRRLSMGRCVGAAAALSLAAWGVHAASPGGVRVFPVKAFFYDAGEQSPLDPVFRRKVETLGVPLLAERIQAALQQRLGDRTGPLDQGTASRTFVASVQVTRATSYAVDKGNGNSDVVASVTASLYFTKVLSGEILSTISRTVVSRGVVANRSSIDAERSHLFEQALDTLITDLATEAAKDFTPTVVEVKVLDRAGGLLVLDSGYKKGIQTNDQLDNPGGQLVQVIYTAENYAVAQPVLADGVGRGAVFQKVLAHASDGKDKPSTVVLVESVPAGFSADFLAQMFSEFAGDKAPLTIVQVNRNFSRLLQTVVQQASLSLTDTARRKSPDKFVRLRVAEPIVYEARTNLEFQTTRHYETLAFADIVDSSGRVLFSAIGKDVINDSITRGIGPGLAERREVSVKNALFDLAQQLAKLSEPRREQATATLPPDGDPVIATAGRFFPAQQKGVILRKARLQGERQPQEFWIPVAEADVKPGAGTNSTELSLGVPFDALPADQEVNAVFEVQRLGTTPLSAHAFSVCGPVDSLTPWKTPSLLDFTSHALGTRMPGVLYVPQVAATAAELINPSTGFARAATQKSPPENFCVQPVERVNVGEETCAQQCERPITARYTLRLKAGGEVVSRVGFESQFKSTGFYKQTAGEQLNRIIEADVVDEAQVLLLKAGEKLDFSVGK